MNKENRKKQREEAVKILYAMELNETNSKAFIDSYMDINNFNKCGMSYFYELLLEYIDYSEEINQILENQSKDYNLKRMSVIDKCIIKASITEMKYLKIPKSVSINEAIEISKEYSDSESYKVVNSLLGKISRSI